MWYKGLSPMVAGFFILPLFLKLAVSMHPLDQKILSVLAKQSDRPFNRRELAGKLRLQGAERKLLTVRLKQLQKTGQVLMNQRGCYRLAAEAVSLEGTVTILAEGFGFFLPADEKAEDIFIPARSLDGVMNGDRVLVQPLRGGRDGRPYGRVVKVLQRAHSSVLGVYQQQRGKAWLMPLDPTIAKTVFVQQKNSIQAEPGQVVKLELDHYPTATSAGSGRIVEVLGSQDDPRVDIETVIRTRGLPQYFSPEAVAEAETVAGQVDAEEIARRTDLRDLPLMTIDGETAKDFDDAVALRRETDGNYRLWVCIADVAHYVAEAGALDHDARERGTSVYFPGHCVPMLPEALSNGICSLNPQVDRLAMVAEMLFNRHGERLSEDFYPAVIRSQARLTYTEVAAYLAAPEGTLLTSAIAEQLPPMAEFAEVLGQMRRERGSLELNLPEVEIILDDTGRPVAMEKIERTIAHRLIEEFMLAANEAVAGFLERRNYSFLYRIHESPTFEKLQDFQQLAAECGAGLVLSRNLQHDLQQLLDDITERPEARLLNQQLLRSLQQARYTPENKGHFGLAAPCYCHFTSPIRRYPDLSVHRTLKKALLQARQTTAPPTAALLELGLDCSAKERRAMAAERDLLELRRCQLMREKVGEQFHGTISSVAEFGFFVELDDLYIEGLVHVRSLTGDYYRFDPIGHTLIGERRRTVFRVGMRVRIRVERVELWRRRIDFTLVERA